MNQLPIGMEEGYFDNFTTPSSTNEQSLSNEQSWSNLPDVNTIVQMKTRAMDELYQLTQVRKPMWIPNVVDNTNSELNEREYLMAFAKGFGPRIPSLKWESSRLCSGFAIDPLVLVGIFMDVDRWKNIFNAIVANARLLDILSTKREGNYDETLQLMWVELHALSPLVPTRQDIIARYCKQLGEGMWGIVDFSIDVFRPIHLTKYRKRPSGCIIESLHNGFAMVTWVENVEVDDNEVPSFYKPLVNSGLAFGAKRWLGILQRQIDRFSFLMATNLPLNDSVVTNLEVKRVITRLAENMVENYNATVSSAAGYPWSIVDPFGPFSIRVLMLRNNSNPRYPLGITLSATNSFWLHVPPRNLFDYLCSKQTRNHWDILAKDEDHKEISRTPIGRDAGSYVSMFQNSKHQMLILQEAMWDPLGAYLIYAPIEVRSLNMVMNGGDPNYVALLSSGFVVVPGGSTRNGIGDGSLVTISFQILVDTRPSAVLDERCMEMVTNLVNYSTNQLKAAFMR